MEKEGFHFLLLEMVQQSSISTRNSYETGTKYRPCPQWTSFGFENGHCTVLFLILHHDSFLGHFLFLEMKNNQRNCEDPFKK